MRDSGDPACLPHCVWTWPVECVQCVQLMHAPRRCSRAAISTAVKPEQSTLRTACKTDVGPVKSVWKSNSQEDEISLYLALFHFPSLSWDIDRIESYLFMLQPPCHELTSTADQIDCGMCRHIALRAWRRTIDTTDDIWSLFPVECCNAAEVPSYTLVVKLLCLTHSQIADYWPEERYQREYFFQ